MKNSKLKTDRQKDKLIDLKRKADRQIGRQRQNSRRN